MPDKHTGIFVLSIVLLSSSVICTQTASADTEKTAQNEQAPQQAHHQNGGVFIGRLAETFDAGGYTYVRLDTDNGPVWAAGPLTAINKDDNVSFIGRVAMTDFYSKSLKRSFKTIYFVDSYIINGVRIGSMPVDPHKNIEHKQATSLQAFSKAEGGLSIAEILNDREALAGKTVRVRGQVSKYTARVMGKNWLHIRDHSSDHDLTITTDANAEINDIILAEGRLVLDKNYGYGYVYDILVEDATVNVENR